MREGAPALLYLGGNGHAPVRLEPARGVLRRLGDPFSLLELDYPAASSSEGLLTALGAAAEEHGRAHPRAPVYATGIGALVALALRARGALLGHPLVLQGGVLWGLEQRVFPRVMRLPGFPALLAAGLRTAPVRRRFAARHFLRAHPPAFLDAFFEGYRDARAFSAWFDWLRPGLLRTLEWELPATQGALEGIEAWWGARDAVVGVEELHVTQRALGVEIPLRVFAKWGHYPMIDDPEGWVTEVRRVVETARQLR